MPRRTRLSAGKAVLTRAQALSDALLVQEILCFDRTTAWLTDGAGTGETILLAGWRRSKKDPAKLARDAKMQQDLVSLHSRVIAATNDHVRLLAETSSGWSLDAIADELAVCESAVAPKYLGCAEIGVNYARSVTPDLVEAMMKIHADSEVAALLYFADALRDQMLMAAQSEDGWDQVVGRVFSPDPFRARGIGGRGVWYRTDSVLNQSARGLCIGLMNKVRQAAMRGMNEAASGV